MLVLYFCFVRWFIPVALGILFFYRCCWGEQSGQCWRKMMPLASVGACSPFDSSSTGGKAGSSLAITLVAAASVWGIHNFSWWWAVTLSIWFWVFLSYRNIHRAFNRTTGSAFCSRLSSGNSDGSGEAFHYGPKSLLHNYDFWPRNTKLCEIGIINDLMLFIFFLKRCW